MYRKDSVWMALRPTSAYNDGDIKYHEYKIVLLFIQEVTSHTNT